MSSGIITGQQAHEVGQSVSVLLARNHVGLVVRHVTKKSRFAGQMADRMWRKHEEIKAMSGIVPGYKRGWR